ncbi:hypothetical protein GGS26DRAFT_566299 [Hypomontagnella submonticulosa]|nr:hypothetical protein GGS26DRAFT_566299 [Hypomontagnella submonticulosa]
MAPLVRIRHYSLKALVWSKGLHLLEWLTAAHTVATVKPLSQVRLSSFIQTGRLCALIGSKYRYSLVWSAATILWC